MGDTSKFLRAFLRDSGKVGAIAPSSTQLAMRMTEWLDWSTIESIVEYGPGTGIFTERIASEMRAGSSFFAIERDPELAAIVRERCPDVAVYESCVTKVAELCGENDISKIDAVLCGLPWAAFPEELQDACLESMFTMLPVGGKFATFAYWQGLALPAGQRFRRKLKERFTTVEISPTAWKNLPPAFVYRCTR